MIAKYPGTCLVPWNIEAHAISEQHGQVMVDGKALIFYHYHALRVINGRLWPWVIQPSAGYVFSDEQLRLIYCPYAAELYALHYRLREAGLRVTLSIEAVDEFLRVRRYRKDLLFIPRDGVVHFGQGQQRRMVSNSSSMS